MSLATIPRQQIKHGHHTLSRARQRELLVFPAVHRDGATRDVLIAALWPDGPRSSDRPTHVLNAVLGRLRRSVAAATDDALADILMSVTVDTDSTRHWSTSICGISMTP